MKRIEPDIPGARITYNYLYDAMPIDWKEEDLLFVVLPNGKTIDVGWYPACDPAGQFRVTLSDSAQNPEKTMRTRDMDQMIRAIEGLARSASPGTDLSVPCSAEYLNAAGAFGVSNTNSTSAIYWTPKNDTPFHQESAR